IQKEISAASKTVVVGNGSDDFMSQGYNKEKMVNAQAIESSEGRFNSSLDDNNIVRREGYH
ncbi:hypothetical protein Tco_1372817, partial [Tanacetum coccineum]